MTQPNSTASDQSTGTTQSVAGTTSHQTATTAITTPSTMRSSGTVGGGGCIDSTDPKCGLFYWDPQPPANHPLSVSVAVQPALPRVGHDVVFSVTFADPDAGQPKAGCDNSAQVYGDGSPAQRHVCDDASKCTWTGAHRPPPPQGDRWVVVYHHLYARSGTFVAEFTGSSATTGVQSHCVDTRTGRPGDPYASSGTAAVTVVVAP